MVEADHFARIFSSPWQIARSILRVLPVRLFAAIRGGARYCHDREVTYSIAIPAETSFGRDHTKLYTCFAWCHIEGPFTSWACRRLRCWTRRSASQMIRRRFFVFNGNCQGRSYADWAKDRWKRPTTPSWRDPAAWQHSFVDLTPTHQSLPGIEQLCGVTLAPQRIVEAIAGELAKAAHLSLSRYRINSDEELEVRLLAESRFDDQKWTGRR